MLLVLCDLLAKLISPVLRFLVFMSQLTAKHGSKLWLSNVCRHMWYEFVMMSLVY